MTFSLLSPQPAPRSSWARSLLPPPVSPTSYKTHQLRGNTQDPAGGFLRRGPGEPNLDTGECGGSRASLRGKLWPEDLSHASSPVTRGCDVLLAGVLSSLCKTVHPAAKYALSLPPPSGRCDKPSHWKTQQGPARDWEGSGLTPGPWMFCLSARPWLARPPKQS